MKNGNLFNLTFANLSVYCWTVDLTDANSSFNLFISLDAADPALTVRSDTFSRSFLMLDS